MPQDVFLYAAGAGVCGASAAVSSKFAFGQYIIEQKYEMFAGALTVFVLSNVLMWWAYTKSLSLADSSVPCLAINTGTNFALTGIFGYLLFAETHSLSWCFGLSMVFIGVCLLVTDDKAKRE